MSQQEIMPEPQSNNKQSGNEEDIENTYAQPYYWSTQPEDVAPQPKEEPASSYDEPLTQNDYAGGYQSQNEMNYSYPENKGSAKAVSDFSQTQGQQGQQQQQFQSQQARNPYSPDGDAFETGYNPYSSYDAGNNWQTRQSVPFWARPQRSQRGGFRWLWIVILAFIFMGPLLHIIGDALFIVFPLLFIGLIVFASAVFWSTIGSRRSRGPGNPNSWRGPRGW